MSRWSETDIPDQSGCTVLVTGANSGLAANLTACIEHTAWLLWERTAQLTGVAPDPA